MSINRALKAYVGSAEMERSVVEGLPLYPEGRACRRPTARKVIDLFEDVQRHTLTSATGPPVVFITELTRLQRKVLRLLGMSDAYDFRTRRPTGIQRFRERNVRKVGLKTRGF